MSNDITRETNKRETTKEQTKKEGKSGLQFRTCLSSCDPDFSLWLYFVSFGIFFFRCPPVFRWLVLSIRLSGPSTLLPPCFFFFGDLASSLPLIVPSSFARFSSLFLSFSSVNHTDFWREGRGDPHRLCRNQTICQV